jgi:hypothetical protein
LGLVQPALNLERRTGELLERIHAKSLFDDGKHWVERVRGKAVLFGVVRLPFFNEVGQALAGTEGLLLAFRAEGTGIHGRHQASEDFLSVRLRMWIDRLA